MSHLAMEAHEAWYENTLKAGTLPFAVRLFGFGTAEPQWWSATWQKPPECVPVKGAWIVNGTLRLTGQPSLEGPVSTSAAAEFRAALWGNVETFLSAEAEAEFVMSLGSAQLASVEFSAALQVLSPGSRVTTLGDVRVTTGGDRRVTTPQ
jgi:hypothetical protein